MMFPLAKTCPTCGSRRIKLVQSHYTSTLSGGRRIVVPDLARQECPDCGEILFDRAAMKKIQAQYPRTRRKTA